MKLNLAVEVLKWYLIMILVIINNNIYLLKIYFPCALSIHQYIFEGISQNQKVLSDRLTNKLLISLGL